MTSEAVVPQTAPDEEPETVLTGGKLNTVVRVGATVRRPSGAWTEVVHDLLQHLDSKGFQYSPRPMGRDEHGREVLSYIAGQTVGEELPWPDWVWTEELLAEIGSATRRYHDAVADFRPEGVIPWFWGPAELASDQIVCHHDVAPYNVVVEAGRLKGIIDWDLTGPGTAMSELAFVAWQWVPLHDPVVTSFFSPHPPDIARRVGILLDAYGLQDRSNFVGHVIDRIHLNRDVMLRKAAAGDQAYGDLVREGHVIGMERAIAYLSEIGDEIRAALA